VSAAQRELFDTSRRAALAARWLRLTRDDLPRLAAPHRWPIRHDHCLMRVCLDAALGERWDSRVRRPALRHLTDDQLEAAVAVAERIHADPALLPVLNAASLRLRGAWHAAPPRG